MTIIEAGPTKVQQGQPFETPSEWEAFTQKGDTVLDCLATARSAASKRRAGKLVECDLEGRNLISSHANHVGFRDLITAMVGPAAPQYERARAAAYLLEHYLATAMKVR